MIESAIVMLQKELQAYLKTKDTAEVIIDNIGMFETKNGDTLDKHIILTLVNIEEESTLKNQPPLRRPIGNSAIYENSPVYLNLYILFTCNYAGEFYRLALKRLGYIIQFLQGKTSFSTSTSMMSGTSDMENDDIVNLKFTMELYTLTFEQINHLWGSLGGRQMPFAMYKLRLVAITERAIVREVPVIEEIETNLSKIAAN